MNWIYLLGFDLACIAGGSWLIINDHQWFGGFLFLLAATTTIKTRA